MNHKIKERNSNLELFRIITMMLIVAHHYVVNSGLFQLMQESDLTFNSIFLYILGMWGKTGINCFVLITGYFMCKSKATVSKFLKLVLEVLFYRIIIYFIFLQFDCISFNLKEFCFLLLPINSITTGFTSAFIAFYLFIPFLNILINNLNRFQHLSLILLSLFIYSFLYMFPGIHVCYNYVTWFIILYFISSYLRLYLSPQYSDNIKFWGLCSFGSISLSIVSVFVFKEIGIYPYMMVADSNAFMAVATSVSLFMLFKNIKLKQNKYINTIAASTFGVLLIHANSDTMRQWLWNDTLKNTEFFTSSYLCVHAIVSVLLVFVVCSFIDILRINFLEVKLMESNQYKRICSSIENLIH